MCCLFGMVDYGYSFSGRQKARMMAVLGQECEIRGTDATGYAYNSDGKLNIYKRPRPAHKMTLFLPNDAHVIMGHTRMTTQGSEKRNCNNHPFEGRAGKEHFALAHNGVLYNDISLRQRLHLPKPSIETDSYIAVQLIEQKKALDFASLKYMAEQVVGSFCFTILDSRNNLWIVKGDNPLCLYDYPELGLYLYASTEEILKKAIQRLPLRWSTPAKINLSCGDILRIDAGGQREMGSFDDSGLWSWGYSRHRLDGVSACANASKNAPSQRAYIDDLKAVAACYGYSEKAIDRMLDNGYSVDEVEEFIYCGEL